MDRLFVIADSEECSRDIGGKLAGVFDTRPFDVRNVFQAEPSKHVIFDIDLEDDTHVVALRHWLECRPKNGKVLFAVEQGVRRQIVQAYALGATDVIDRPIGRQAVLTKLLGNIGALAGEGAELSAEKSEGMRIGISALQTVFAAVVSGTPVDMNTVRSAGDTVVSNIQEDGIARWIDGVRRHHSLTYQHSLLVTGIAVAFGQHLGLSQRDRQTLALCGLLHDVGKAGVPVEILEKPGRLTKEEFATMKEHPVMGFEALRGVEGLYSDMLEVVVHHHEYLDGSGYPHGLDASQISDLVRLTTIADVFGALLERRSYKPAMSGAVAYQILEDMGPKLDKDLVRAFRLFARAQIR